MTVQRNYCWVWAVGHRAERPKISGTIIQKDSQYQDCNEQLELKKYQKKKKKKISMVKEKYKLASEINIFSEIQVRDKVHYIKYQSRNVNGRNGFICFFMKTGIY